MTDEKLTNQVIQDLYDIETQLANLFKDYKESTLADVLYYQQSRINPELRTLLHNRLYND